VTRRTSQRARDEALRFSERYRVWTNDAAARVERAVIGAAYGANGYTTLAQANTLRRALRLRAGMRLLDIGAGRGWPGLYLARETGCEAVLCDVPRPAAKVAVAQAGRLRLRRRLDVAQATADALPFRPHSFDAIVHTDVLC
jgi:2-polyprenyl-3-methyl-5-hydroxy-6-metoxy-1,4-benzoquinol methylase